MKIIPITKEIFYNLVDKNKLVCSDFIFELSETNKIYSYFITEEGIPFSVLNFIKRYIYDGTKKDPLLNVSKIKISVEDWSLNKIEELDKTFFTNSFSMMCSGCELVKDYFSSKYEDKPKPIEEGIYILSLPIIGFSKKIWIKFIKYYEWTSWDLTIAYENMIDESQGFYYSRLMKRDYLNIVGGKIYVNEENNIEEGP